MKPWQRNKTTYFHSGVDKLVRLHLCLFKGSYIFSIFPLIFSWICLPLTTASSTCHLPFFHINSKETSKAPLSRTLKHQGLLTPPPPPPPCKPGEGCYYLTFVMEKPLPINTIFDDQVVPPLPSPSHSCLNEMINRHMQRVNSLAFWLWGYY